MTEEIPPTRWELAGEGNKGFGERFSALIESGEDIEGEARLADVLVGRGSRILDAGAGLGRVGAALLRRGHRVTAVEKDQHLIGLARRFFPELPMVESDILGLDTGLLESRGAATTYDLVVLVGNVLVLGAEGGEPRMLRTLASLLTEGGRILVGFHLDGGPAHKREYTWPGFEADVAEAGLRVQHHFGGYDLRAPDDQYVVAVLTR